MKQPFELSIALRYLRARRRESFISFISLVSMLGIGLAVAVLIVVTSVMDGFDSREGRDGLAFRCQGQGSRRTGAIGPAGTCRQA